VQLLRDESFGSDLWVREWRLPTRDNASLALFVREKHSRSRLSVGDAARTLLIVADDTFPTSTSLNLPLDGALFADFAARSGHDVFLVDVRGFGRADRPAEMSAPPDAHGPIVNTSVAADGLLAAASLVVAERGVARLNLLGWSWGASAAALFATRHPELAGRLVLYAPQ
jgi:hypothetical protein